MKIYSFTKCPRSVSHRFFSSCIHPALINSLCVTKRCSHYGHSRAFSHSAKYSDWEQTKVLHIRSRNQLITEHPSGRISLSIPSFHNQRRDRNQKIMKDCIINISVRARRPCEDFSPWKTRRNEEMKHDDSFYRFLSRSCTFSSPTSLSITLKLTAPERTN
jgi:hypothetical protein